MQKIKLFLCKVVSSELTQANNLVMTKQFVQDKHTHE